MSPMPFCPSLEPWAKTHARASQPSQPESRWVAASPPWAPHRDPDVNERFCTRAGEAPAAEPHNREISQRHSHFRSFGPVHAFPKTWPLAIIVGQPDSMMARSGCANWRPAARSTRFPRSKWIAEINSAKTIAKPAAEPTLITSSTGSRGPPRLNADPPEEVSTPIRFQQPDQTRRKPGFSCVGVNYGCPAFAVSWNPLTNSKLSAQCQRQSRNMKRRNGQVLPGKIHDVSFEKRNHESTGELLRANNNIRDNSNTDSSVRIYRGARNGGKTCLVL